jgi:hypothetical protein
LSARLVQHHRLAVKEFLKKSGRALLRKDTGPRVTLSIPATGFQA